MMQQTIHLAGWRLAADHLAARIKSQSAAYDCAGFLGGHMLPMAGSIRRLHIQTLSAAVRVLLLTAITSLA